MESWVGGIIAASVAWISILVAIRLPEANIGIDKLRLVGGMTIALFGLQILGMPIPSWAPLVVFAVGFTVILAQRFQESFNN